MYDNFSVEHWDRLWRLAIAQMVILIMFAFNVMTLSIPMLDVIRPAFFLMGLFYWAIYRPALLSVLWVLLLGIVYDVLMGFPIGLHSLLFLLIQYVIKTQRLFFMGQSFITIWFGFVLALALLLFSEWVIFSLLQGVMVNIKETAWSLLLSVFLFPFISMLLFLIHKMLPVTNDAHVIGNS